MDCAPILREHPLFRNLSAEQMRLVADLAEEHTVPAGAVLSQQADLGATLFIIGEGEAVVHHIDGQGLRRPVAMISAGMIYGVTSLFLQDPRDATVTTASPVRLWTIRREPFQRLLAGARPWHGASTSPARSCAGCAPRCSPGWSRASRWRCSRDAIPSLSGARRPSSP